MWCAKLVSSSAERLRPVVQELKKRDAPIAKGYRLRVVDGNHLPASEKRLKPLRGFRGAALPGQSLVVYDPDLELAVDVLPCEDAHTQERVLMRTIIETAVEGDLWMGDRNFCHRSHSVRIHRARGALSDAANMAEIPIRVSCHARAVSDALAPGRSTNNRSALRMSTVFAIHCGGSNCA